MEILTNLTLLVENWQMPVMWIIGGILIYLAIAKDMEPTLLLPRGFGAILVNLPNSGATEVIETLYNAYPHRPPAAVIRRELPAEGKAFLKIPADIRNGAYPVQQHRIFKVQIEAAEIQVDGSHHGGEIIGEHLLGMEKTRAVFEDAHAGAHQLGIIGSGELVNQLFIRNSGRDDAHIHAAPGR